MPTDLNFIYSWCQRSQHPFCKNDHRHTSSWHLQCVDLYVAFSVCVYAKRVMIFRGVVPGLVFLFIYTLCYLQVYLRHTLLSLIM